jgi:hypothetical protein
MQTAQIENPAPGASKTLELIDVAAINAAEAREQPFNLFYGRNIIRESALASVRADFPHLDVVGFLTVKAKF